MVHYFNKVTLLAQAVGRLLEDFPVMEHLGEVETTASAAFEHWGQKSQVETQQLFEVVLKSSSAAENIKNYAPNILLVNVAILQALHRLRNLRFFVILYKANFSPSSF